MKQSQQSVAVKALNHRVKYHSSPSMIEVQCSTLCLVAAPQEKGIPKVISIRPSGGRECLDALWQSVQHASYFRLNRSGPWICFNIFGFKNENKKRR